MIDKLREIHKYGRLFEFEYSIDIEYGALNSFIIDSKSLINSKGKELENKIEQWKTELLSYNDAPEPFEMYETDIIEFNQFSSLLNNSFFIMSYSIFERYLFEICVYSQQEEGVEKSVKDINEKSYIDQCRKYLVEIIEVDLANIQAEWAEIKKYQKIRNAVAHNHGVLKTRDENLINFININKSIKIDELTLTVAIELISFISDFTNLTKEYISKLLKEIDGQKRK